MKQIMKDNSLFLYLKLFIVLIFLALEKRLIISKQKKKQIGESSKNK
jgi:hypothetical protein